MFTKRSFLLAALALGTVLAIGGCSGPTGNNPSGQNNSSSNNANSQEEIKTDTNSDKTVVYFFWGEGCAHCAKQKPWLEELEKEHANLEVKMLETYNNQENAKLFQEMARAYGAQARGVPVTFIGDHDPIAGFSESIKLDIKEKIETCLDEGCIDPGSKL